MAEDSNDIESIQMRGLTLYRLGRPAEAIPFLERVRQWTPDANADANYVLGLCYMNAQRYEEARKRSPHNTESIQLQERLAFWPHRCLHMRIFRISLVKKHRRRSSCRPIFHWHISFGEIALSKSDLPMHWNIRTGTRNQSFLRSRVRQVGRRLYQNGSISAGQESLTKAISLDQSTTGPFILMGRVFLRRNDPQTALMYLQHAEKMDPANYITHTLLGQAYRGVGKEEEAKRELETASKIHSASQLKLQPVQ